VSSGVHEILNLTAPRFNELPPNDLLVLLYLQFFFYRSGQAVCVRVGNCPGYWFCFFKVRLLNVRVFCRTDTDTTPFKNGVIDAITASFPVAFNVLSAGGLVNCLNRKAENFRR